LCCVGGDVRAVRPAKCGNRGAVATGFSWGRGVTVFREGISRFFWTHLPARPTPTVKLGRPRGDPPPTAPPES